MKPKHRLILLACVATFVSAMLVWCLKTHNTLGAVIDAIVLLFYGILGVQDVKRFKK